MKSFMDLLQTVFISIIVCDAMYESLNGKGTILQLLLIASGTVCVFLYVYELLRKKPD